MLASLRRQFQRYAPLVWRRLPSQHRLRVLEWGFRHFPALFEGHPHFERWQREDHAELVARTQANNLVDIETATPLAEPPGSIAIHLHVFYEELADELAAYVAHVPFAYDLYVSVASEAGERACRRAFPRATIQIVPPRGRDIAPFFCAFDLRTYDFVAHLHGKKSTYSQGETEGWREYLFDSLLGSEERVRRILSLLVDGKKGIVYPQNFYLLPYMANTWLGTRELGRTWCDRLGIAMPDGYFDYPAGSMFWARGDALRPLFDAKISIDDFPPEEGQLDGTLAHCLERLFALVAQPAILRDEKHPAWSAWRFDQYFRCSKESLLRVIGSKKVIGFDLYDTLLTRPVIHAEDVKRMIARRAGEPAFVAQRTRAEVEARIVTGRDVGLDDIYTRMPAQLRAIEEEVEQKSVSARADVVALFTAAKKDKRVVLISDTCLPRHVIEAELRENGIDGWDALFISSEAGVRKDSGTLYDRVLEHYGIAPSDMLMIGDNERADWQMPQSRGIAVQHVLRPVELARGWPRFGPLVDRWDDLDAQLTLALVVRRTFDVVTPPFPDPTSLVGDTPEAIGYGVVGPVLLGFAEWLRTQSRHDGIRHVLFLAREGQLMQRVYDAWCGSQSRYLVLSRRATGVASIESWDDILTIARADFWPSPRAVYLRDRFGVELDIPGEIEVVGGNVDEALLASLKEKIFAQAAQERRGLEQYLGDLPPAAAVVDVGYAGTIQRHLAKLGHAVRGYYLMTNDRADDSMRGCFAERIADSDAPRIYTQRFEIERLLSSNDPQVVRYDEEGRPELRTLTSTEKAAAAARAALQGGVMRYVADAVKLREVVPDFAPSAEVGRALLEQFLAAPSEGERALLRSITLDDHHHGRGVV